MLLTVAELEREPIAFNENIAAGVIDFGDELHALHSLHTEGVADLLREHRGPHDVVLDIRLRAGFQAQVEVLCARCLEPVKHALDQQFDLLFRPVGVDGGGDERSISPSETEIGYYEKNGLLLEDVLREQILLSLPARTLCAATCKGLCTHCGRNLNTETCNCANEAVDPRWSTLGAIRGQISTSSQGKP